MGGLWPVFGLLVLTIEWVVLRRVAPRLQHLGAGVRALVGAAAGLALSAGIAGLGLLLAIVATLLGLGEDALQVVAAAFSVMFVTGFLFAPIAAAFGALLVALYRAPAEREGELSTRD